MSSALAESRIGVIGLGYVGLPLAVEFGKIRPVLGFDVNPERIRELMQGIDRTQEVPAADLLEARHLGFTQDSSDLRSCNLFIVTVPTPIDEHNRPDLAPLLAATKTIACALKKGDVVIYESTVYPGCTEDDCVPILEKLSGLQFNVDFTVGYSPERINPGDKQRGFTTIRKVTSGSTQKTADLVDALYASVVTAGTHRASSIKVAEAAKIIENTQRDLNIALMNELSLLFNQLDIDTQEVLAAAGTKWNFLPFRPGLVGGHCIGVDPYYLTHRAEKAGYIPQVILAGRRINDSMAQHVARITIKKMIQSGIDLTKATVGILGITFKENCPDIRNSKVIDIVRELQDYGINVVVEDYWANPDEISREYRGIELENISPERPVDALIVAVAHERYANYAVGTLRALLRGNSPVLADVKSLYDSAHLQQAGVNSWRL